MCNVGYSLVGNVLRTCDDDGHGWLGKDPQCGIIYPRSFLSINAFNRVVLR